MANPFPGPDDLIKRLLFPGVHAFVCAGEHMTLSRVHFDEGGVVERHAHPHEQVGILVRGRARFEIGEESRILEAGEIYRIPGGTLHRVTAIQGPVIAFDVFFPSRPEYLVEMTNA